MAHVARLFKFPSLCMQIVIVVQNIKITAKFVTCNQYYENLPHKTVNVEEVWSSDGTGARVRDASAVQERGHYRVVGAVREVDVQVLMVDGERCHVNVDQQFRLEVGQIDTIQTALALRYRVEQVPGVREH